MPRIKSSSFKGRKQVRSSLGCKKDHHDDATESLLGKSYHGRVGAGPLFVASNSVSFFSLTNLTYWFIAVLPLVIGAVSLGLTFWGHMRVDDDVNHLITRVNVIDANVTNTIEPQLDLVATVCLSPNRYIFDSVSSFYVV